MGLDQAIARLQKISGAAVSALLKVMFDPGSPPAAQLKAAETGGKPPEGSMRQSIYRELEKLGSMLPPGKKTPVAMLDPALKS